MPHRKIPGISAVLASQFFIVLLGALGIWLVDFSAPAEKINWLTATALGTLLAVLTFLFFIVLYRMGGKFVESLLDDIRRVTGLFKGYSWAKIICIAALAGLGEELLFRGFLQNWLAGYVHVALAILIASIIFGLLHYLSHAYFISTVIMSIAFGAGYYYSSSLLMVVVWHGVYDLIALGAIIKFPHFIGLGNEISLRNNQ
jgi:membrane protease YdiL (CAAX protease family)